MCNNGMGNVCHYLTFKKDGRTKMLYLPTGEEKEAKEMSRRYKRVKEILLKISRLNYEALNLKKAVENRNHV